MNAIFEQNQQSISRTESILVNENYQLAFQYLDEIYFREMTSEERKSWETEEGSGGLLHFYLEFINRYPHTTQHKVKTALLILKSGDMTKPFHYQNRKNWEWHLWTTEGIEVIENGTWNENEREVIQ